MDSDDAFITRLIGFGLTEKEARLYLHLLKYGPKTPSPLAKSLKTYREDVHRTLNSLIEKGMVNPSLDAPTVYAAVELDIALDAAVKKHESELREMEARKKELEELSRQQRFRPSDEVSTFKILKSVKELIAVSISSLASIEEELLYVVPGHMIVISSVFGINEATKKLLKGGGRSRGITDISYSFIKPTQELLDNGEDLRHFGQYQGILFGVLDRRICFSVMRPATTMQDDASISLDQSISVLWTDDPTYANYLMATFETLWEQAVPAEQRIQELLEQGPPHV